MLWFFNLSLSILILLHFLFFLLFLLFFLYLFIPLPLFMALPLFMTLLMLMLKLFNNQFRRTIQWSIGVSFHLLLWNNLLRFMNLVILFSFFLERFCIIRDIVNIDSLFLLSFIFGFKGFCQWFRFHNFCFYLILHWLFSFLNLFWFRFSGFYDINNLILNIGNFLNFLINKPSINMSMIIDFWILSNQIQSIKIFLLNFP